MRNHTANRSILTIGLFMLVSTTSEAQVIFTSVDPTNDSSIHHYSVVPVSSASTANSSTIFDFQHNGSTAVSPSLAITQGSFNLAVLPFTSTDPNGTSSPVWSVVSGTGLGIYTGTTGLGVISYSNDNNDLDGATQMDALRFTFSTAVKLEAIHFTHVGSSDDYNLTIDGALRTLDSTPNPLDLDGMRDVWVPVNFSGTEFTIWADGSSDDFRIAGLQVAAVPEPSTFILMATGLLMAGLFRRYRRQ